jgi:hypothetical protein
MASQPGGHSLGSHTVPTLLQSCASGTPGGAASRGSAWMQNVWQSSPLWHDAASAIGTITVTASIAGSVSRRTTRSAYHGLLALGCIAEVTMDADLRHA